MRRSVLDSCIIKNHSSRLPSLWLFSNLLMEYNDNAVNMVKICHLCAHFNHPLNRRSSDVAPPPKLAELQPKKKKVPLPTSNLNTTNSYQLSSSHRRQCRTPKTPGYNLYMPDHHHAGLSPALVESVAGLSAGTIATLVVHPLDIVKTRMQSTSFPSQNPNLQH